MKKCNRCKLEKELIEFGKDKSQRDGVNRKCKKCNCEAQQLRKEEKAAYDKVYRVENKEKLTLREQNRDKEKLRLYKLKTKFALSKEDEEKMLLAQDHKCAICKKPEWVVVRGKVKRLAVDHDKKTGKVRGLLCNNCNRALGMLYENITTLKNMISYIIFHLCA
jgi:hypothetical protein